MEVIGKLIIGTEEYKVIDANWLDWTEEGDSVWGVYTAPTDDELDEIAAMMDEDE